MRCKVFLIAVLILIVQTHAFSKEEDGIWFLGFNFKQPLWQKDSGQNLRRIMLSQISRQEINQALWNESPTQFPWVPYGTLKDSDSKISVSEEWKKNVLAQLTASQKNELKELVVLHTDGPQTLLIFYQLRAQLQKLGVHLVSMMVPMYPQDLWEKALQKNQHHLFLMGYKATDYPSANSLLCPLLASYGQANFTNYQNIQFDAVCSGMVELAAGDIEFLQKDLPIWPIYYIEKLP